MRVNDRIRAREVRLVDADGTQVGLLSLEDALAKATVRNLDLVEVAPEADPPVCKIMDYQRHAFEQKRRFKESRKKTKNLELKEIKFRPNIDVHDYGYKLKQARDFLEKGHKVKITVRYRPREMRHYEIGTQLIQRVIGDVADLAAVDATVRTRGASRMQVIVLAPKKKAGAVKV